MVHRIKSCGRRWPFTILPHLASSRAIEQSPNTPAKFGAWNRRGRSFPPLTSPSKRASEKVRFRSIFTIPQKAYICKTLSYSHLIKHRAPVLRGESAMPNSQLLNCWSEHCYRICWKALVCELKLELPRRATTSLIIVVNFYRLFSVTVVLLTDSSNSPPNLHPRDSPILGHLESQEQ